MGVIPVRNLPWPSQASDREATLHTPLDISPPNFSYPQSHYTIKLVLVVVRMLQLGLTLGEIVD
jgi:hypothetical protein